jgi:hypothetical protein
MVAMNLANQSRTSLNSASPSMVRLRCPSPPVKSSEISTPI